MRQAASSGGGGSGYIHTTSSHFPSSYAFQNGEFTFDDPQCIQGYTEFSSPLSLNETEIGHSGYGAIRITILKYLQSKPQYYCVAFTVANHLRITNYLICILYVVIFS